MIKLYEFTACEQEGLKVQHWPDPKVPTIKAQEVEDFLLKVKKGMSMNFKITKAQNGIIVRTQDGKLLVFTDMTLFWSWLKEVWQA